MNKLAHQDSTRPARKGYALWHGEFSRSGCDQGAVITPHGVVACYAQGNDFVPPLTLLQFVRQGTVHERRWQCRLTRGRITALACQFAKTASEREGV